MKRNTLEDGFLMVMISPLIFIALMIMELAMYPPRVPVG